MAVPDDVVRRIEEHLAPEGTVMLVRPVLIKLGASPPGARQYRVSLITGYGRSQDHTVEVDEAGRVHTLL
jgi:hypothetical protein